jgi:hypothetical protein
MEEKITYAPVATTQVLQHLCRHFAFLPESDISKLIKLGIENSKIEQDLKLVGSKFYSAPFPGIFSLTEYIDKNWDEKKIISYDQKFLVSQFTFKKSEYPNGIGNDGLISFDSLDANEISKVYKKKRESSIVNAYPTSNKFPTWEFIVVSQTQPTHEIITIYPGTYAPPLPMDTMSPEVFKVCDEFWKVHALIESI